MRLDLLLAREPFAETFSKTLSVYLKRSLGWKGRIEWLCKNNLPINLPVGNFLLNDKLNLIYPSRMSSTTLRQLGAEYIYHPNLIRRWLQFFYVTLTVTKYLRKLISNSLITIDPLPEMAKQWCILPGNHTFRILDLGNNYSVVLLKHGFNEKYISSEVGLRKRFSDLPGPKILDANLDEGWYVEEIISGLPLNRLAEESLATTTLLAAQSAMMSLYKRTLQSLAIDEWLVNRGKQFHQAVQSLPDIYDETTRNSIVYHADNLLSFIKDGTSSDQLLPLAITHGDFQDANILRPQDKLNLPVYLIDWEYSAQRCIWYDALVYSLKSRFPRELSSRVNDWITDKSMQHDALSWCGTKSLDQMNAKMIIASFLVEDLIVRMGDTTIPGLKVPQSGFLTFVDEVGKVGNLLTGVDANECTA